VKIRRPFRAVVYAAVIAAAAAYIVFSAARQPAFINGTFIGTFTADLFGKVRSTGRQTSLFYFRHQQNAWEILDSSQALGTDFVTCSISSAPYRIGLWHLILEERGVRVEFHDHSSVIPLDATQRSEILRVLATAHPGVVPADKFGAYVAGGTMTRGILWLGVLGDLSILAAFAVIVSSLVKLRREIRWRKPGCCTTCDYDLAGLSADKCPECGAAINS